jgi:hypothetical protein
MFGYSIILYIYLFLKCSLVCHVKNLVLLFCSKDILQNIGQIRDALIVLIRRSNAKIPFLGGLIVG